MRKLILMVTVFFFLISPAVADIVGSKHDLSVAGGGSVKDAATKQVCVFCHTPHGASTTVTGPLWNRGPLAAAASTNATFAYTDPSGTMVNGAPHIDDVNDTDAPLCLSCHDGSIGNTLENQPNDVNVSLVSEVAFAASAANLGADLSNDHPIGMVYDNVGDTELVAAAGGLPLFTSAIGGATPVQTAGVVWCSSCHDVHGKYDGVSADYPYFLNDTMDGSALCLNFHDK